MAIVTPVDFSRFPSTNTLLGAYKLNVVGADPHGLNTLVFNHPDVSMRHTEFYVEAIANYGHAMHLLQQISDGNAIRQSPTDPDAGRVLGGAAAFVQLCGFPQIADQFMAAIPNIMEERSLHAGFVSKAIAGKS